MPQAFERKGNDSRRDTRAAAGDNGIVEIDAGIGEDRAQRGEILQAAVL
jgi:hypothetical protein